MLRRTQSDTYPGILLESSHFLSLSPSPLSPSLYHPVNSLLLPLKMKLTIACYLLLAATAGITHAAAAAPTTTDAWEPAPFMEEVRSLS